MQTLSIDSFQTFFEEPNLKIHEPKSVLNFVRNSKNVAHSVRKKMVQMLSGAA
jgi:hypothetical protein